MIAAVVKAFPGDGIVGEEDSDILRQQQDKRDVLWASIKEVLEEEKASEEELGTIGSAEEMMDLIDKGNHAGGATGSKFYTHSNQTSTQLSFPHPPASICK